MELELAPVELDDDDPSMTPVEPELELSIAAEVEASITVASPVLASAPPVDSLVPPSESEEHACEARAISIPDNTRVI